MESPNTTWKAVGGRIRQLRKAKNWSGAELGERVGVGTSEVSRVETGAQIKDDTLERYAAALGVTAAYLRYGTTTDGGDVDRLQHDAYERGRTDAIALVQREINTVLDRATARPPEPSTDIQTVMARLSRLAASINTLRAREAPESDVAPLVDEARTLIRESLAKSGADREITDALASAFLEMFAPTPTRDTSEQNDIADSPLPYRASRTNRQI